MWLDAMLTAVRDARERLTQPGGLRGDDEPTRCERALIDELVSARLLDMLSSAERTWKDAARLKRQFTYRDLKGFVKADASASSLERYLARAARLKKHFDEVLSLERETSSVDDRVQRGKRLRCRRSIWMSRTLQNVPRGVGGKMRRPRGARPFGASDSHE